MQMYGEYELTDEQYTELGQSVVDFLGLKQNKETGRYDTKWGDKTALGIGRCVERCVENATAPKVNLT